ncbi:hypothetical protein FD723_40505 (plasmid) [Nostoc sp. C052]|uniref:hypothetical protein n=1 Tax=Nostoc sp. C052 TaxID=2576902 RepID=UPI0015C3E816|nr:hypothetical protein [Nostoc sp. C052]QLE46496.1 hypothetical protein FD723_40505 [Nostoc sp. C052]
MTKQDPKALFVISGGEIQPENVICSGLLAYLPLVSKEQGSSTSCSYYVNGVFPEIKPLDEKDPLYSIDKGNPGDLAPTCALCQHSSLENSQKGSRSEGKFPQELLPLRLFRCRQGLFLVVPGLYDDSPQEIKVDAV